MSQEISVVIPVFNEERNIGKLVLEIKTHLKDLSKNFEIIFVDDGSVDKTWTEILNEAKRDNRVIGLKFSRNFGHHYAITAGIHKSSGELVIVMDGDLQDKPEVIPDLLVEAKKGFDVVFVNRVGRTENIIYRLTQKLFYFILRFLSGFDFDSRQANFSIINKKVVEAFKNFPENARFYGSTIKWLGFRTSSIDAKHGKRFTGRPAYTLRKRIKLAADIILAFSDRPLKFAIGLGIVISFFSVIMVCWLIVGVYSWGFTVIGWPSIVAAIFFSTGIILIVLGIMGVYLGQVFKEVKNRPLYIVSETTDELK